MKNLRVSQEPLSALFEIICESLNRCELRGVVRRVRIVKRIILHQSSMK